MQWFKPVVLILFTIVLLFAYWVTAVMSVFMIEGLPAGVLALQVISGVLMLGTLVWLIYRRHIHFGMRLLLLLDVAAICFTFEYLVIMILRNRDRPFELVQNSLVNFTIAMILEIGLLIWFIYRYWKKDSEE